METEVEVIAYGKVWVDGLDGMILLKYPNTYNDLGQAQILACGHPIFGVIPTVHTLFVHPARFICKYSPLQIVVRVDDLTLAENQKYFSTFRKEG